MVNTDIAFNYTEFSMRLKIGRFLAAIVSQEMKTARRFISARCFDVLHPLMLAIKER